MGANIKTYGIIADIHSNLAALEATLADFETRQLDGIICAGDIIGIGAHSEECVQLIKQQYAAGKIKSLVLGNHEKYLLHGIPVYNHNDPAQGVLPKSITDLFAWNFATLSQDSINFIRQLPLQDCFNVDDIALYNAHYPYLDQTTFNHFVMTPKLSECEELHQYAKTQLTLDAPRAEVYIFGHTHIRIFEQSERALYINPGSNGCPIETDSAPAGLLTLEPGQPPRYQHLDIVYDYRAAARDLLHAARDYPAITYTVDQFYLSEE